MSASILFGFDFVLGLFTLPVRAPVTPAAVQERLAGAPMSTARLGHGEVAIAFVVFKLPGTIRRCEADCRAQS